ncbi:MAG: DUF4832 domain-containing protein [Candidatus Zipacnadales bacterium]
MLTLLLVTMNCLSANAQTSNLISLTPLATDVPLLNPGMGVYLMVGNKEQPDPNLWFMHLCGIAYHRCHWSALEPERGRYQFDEYLGPMFDYWVGQLGKRVAFRVMSESMHGHTKYVTPEWVFRAGVPGVKHVGLYEKEQIDPVFWDPLYLDLQCEFIRAFGEWADGREGLEFVDIGSIGEWGEMHFGLHIPGRWTAEELQQTGFTEYKLALAYRRIIDAYAEAFPHTRVFLNVGAQNYINDYAAMRGIHFRQDGLGLNGASCNVESRLYPEYATKGVQCNLELVVGYDEMKQRGWDPRQVIQKGLEAPLSYQNINFGGIKLLSDPPAEVREAIEYCARHIGYRFALRELQIPAKIHSWPHLEGRLPLQQTWFNEGVAPCYQNLAVEWSVLAPDGQVVATKQDFPEIPTRSWWPGTEVKIGTILALPQAIPPGQYSLAVRLFLPEEPMTPYYLPLAGHNGQGVYHIAPIEVVPAEEGEAQSYVWNFEAGLGFVVAANGITADVVADPVHGGERALRFAGESRNTWNFGQIATVPVLPGARYRLSAWVLIRVLEPLTNHPKMKVGFNGAEGKWITNAFTQPYDVQTLDTWQHLVAEFDTPLSAVTGNVTVERSALADTITAEIYVDDVELTLLAAP